MKFYKSILLLTIFCMASSYALNLQLWRPKSYGLGESHLYYSSWNKNNTFAGGIFTSYHYNPIQYQGDSLSFFNADLNMYYAGFKNSIIEFNIPFSYFLNVDDQLSSYQNEGFYFDDIEMSFIYNFLNNHYDEGVGFSLLLNLMIAIDDDSEFSSNQEATGGFKFLVDYKTSALTRYMFNVGFHNYNDSQLINDTYRYHIEWGLGYSRPLDIMKEYILNFEVYGSIPMKHSNRTGLRNVPTELKANLFKYDYGSNSRYHVGVGVGLNDDVRSSLFLISAGWTANFGGSKASEYTGAITDVRVEVRDIEKDPHNLVQLMLPDDAYGWTGYDPANTQGYDRLTYGLLKRKYKNKKLIIPMIHFATDKDLLKSDFRKKLSLVTKIMKENESITKLGIFGHTDSDADSFYNYGLSRKRAQMVKRYLEKQGIDEGRLVIRRYGEDKPLKRNISSANKKLNRRVEFVILEHSKNAMLDHVIYTKDGYTNEK